MTRTAYYTATSIDGFIADADNSLGWLFEVGAGGGGASLLPRRLTSAELTLTRVEHDAFFVHLTYTLQRTALRLSGTANSSG